MKKLISKTYFKNFFGFITIFIGATLVFALSPGVDDAMKFVEGKERDMKAKELGLSYKDFREKHKDVLDL